MLKDSCRRRQAMGWVGSQEFKIKSKSEAFRKYPRWITLVEFFTRRPDALVSVAVLAI